MRIALLALLVLGLALSGCTSKGKGGDDGEATTSTTSTSTSATATSTSATATTSQAPKPNQAPTGSLSVSVNGTKATFNLTGSDPDGDALAWTLAFGDNSTNQTGTALPANATHDYAAGGVYVVDLVLGDGKATARYNATLNLTGPSSAVVQAYSGNFFSQNPRCANAAEPYDAVPDSGKVTYDSVPVLAGTEGRPFTVVFSSGAAMDAILFADAAGAVLLELKTGLPSDADWTSEGTVPATAVTVAFYGCGTLPNTSDDVPTQPVGETFDYVTA